MNPENRATLAARVRKAAEEALARQGYVSVVDIFLGTGWLAPSRLKRWRTGQLECLESAVQVNLSRLGEALREIHTWASAKGLLPSETVYVARTPARAPLRFSRSGDPDVERAYRTHWISSELSPRKRQRLEERANQVPELVVIQPQADWACHRCSGSGDFLIMEGPGPLCLRCAGLEQLEFLPSGDPALTRRAKAKSTVHAVVVRFSRTRRRYERQGVLVEPDALRAAEGELAMNAPRVTE
jgi:hypothetical protein